MNPLPTFTFVASLFVPEAEYIRPYWIADEGNYVRDGLFNPNAFDPQSPNARRHGKHFKLSSSGDDLHPDPFDLDNLLFLNKQKVLEFLEQLEEAAVRAKREGKKVVAIISTGGTLTMSRDEHGVLVPKMNPQQLVDAAGSGISNDYIPVGMELMRLDSSQYEYAYGGDLTIVKSFIWSQASGVLKDVLIGFETPHGTDTNTESGTNVMAQLGPNIPFNDGFVSAQRTLEHKPNDIGTNIYLTTVLLELMTRKRFNTLFISGGGSSGGALNPAWSVKVSDTKARTFQSVYGPAYADTEDFLVSGISTGFQDQYRKSMSFGTEDRFLPFIIDGYKSVVQIGAEVARNPQIVHDTIVSAAEKCRGIVGILLTTFGAFTDNNKNLSVVKRLKEQYDLLLFASSPFAQGTAHDYESAKRIQDELGGIITRMSPHAASTTVTMANRIWPGNKEKIREFATERDFVGMQAPLPDTDKAGLQFSEIKHVGAPAELFQRKPV